MKKFTATILVLFMVVMSGPASVYAAWSEQQHLVNPNGDNNVFGSVVDIKGDYAIVGAVLDDYNSAPQYSGSVWIYKRSGATWSYTTGTDDCDDNPDNECIKEPIPVQNNHFGRSVSIDGNFAVIKACDPNTTVGCDLYIYKNNGSDVWTNVASIPGTSNNDAWGSPIDLDGDYLAVGYSYYNSFQGAVEIYKRDTDNSWPLLATITASDGSVGDYFNNLHLDGDNLIVGAEDKNNSTGGVYFYNKGAGGDADWDDGDIDEMAMFDGEFEYDSFGGSVWIDGDYASVGAFGYPNGNWQGKAYIYYNNAGTWELQDEITASDGQVDEGFGGSISNSNDKLAVVAWGYEAGDWQGAAYFYTRSGTTWGDEQKVIDAGGGPDDGFGTGLAMDGDYAIIGAQHYNDSIGESFIYNFTPAGGGAVPEFSDYLLMLTVIIAVGLMVKTVPNITGAPAARA